MEIYDPYNPDFDHRSIRECNAPFGFETRGVMCPDGLTRLITYPQQLWDWLDHFIEEQYCLFHSLDFIVEHSWSAAQKTNPDNVPHAFAHTLRKLIVYHYESYNNSPPLCLDKSFAKTDQ